MTAMNCPMCGGKIQLKPKTKKAEIVKCQWCGLPITINGSKSFDLYSSANQDYSQDNQRSRNHKNLNFPKCPLCGEKVKPQQKYRIGGRIVCLACEAELEVIRTNPLEFG